MYAISVIFCSIWIRPREICIVEFRGWLWGFNRICINAIHSNAFEEFHRTAALIPFDDLEIVDLRPYTAVMIGYQKSDYSLPPPLHAGILLSRFQIWGMEIIQNSNRVLICPSWNWYQWGIIGAVLSGEYKTNEIEKWIFGGVVRNFRKTKVIGEFDRDNFWAYQYRQPGSSELVTYSSRTRNIQFQNRE
jgi:hypothetical protein